MLDHIDGKTLKLLFKGGSQYLSNKSDEVNKLNVFPVPDGDTGSNMAYTLDYAVKEMEKASDNINDILNNLSRGALLGAKGNSGVILSQIIRGFAKSLLNHDIITTKDFAEALNMGSSVAYKAVMKPTEGTILTVVRDCANEALKLSKIKDFEVFIDGIVKAAAESVERTPDLLPVLKQAGVVDSGGKGFLFILLGMLETIKGHEVVQEYTTKDVSTNETDLTNINFKYCTEMLINANSQMSHKLKSEIESFGDSLIVVGDDDLIKVHIHTNNPGLVLQNGLKYGDLLKVKIDNMKIQHENVILESKNNLKQDNSLSAKKYGFLAVSPGDGISKIFKELGCDVVIDGGQTMNPSALDILNGLEKINAENIIVFPNNKNIIMTCEQAMTMSDKNIYVIATESFNQAISAIINVDANMSIDDVIRSINDTIEKIRTIEITYSIRDSVIDGIDIKSGDILGFVDGKFTAIGTDYNEVALKIISDNISEDTAIITVYYGKDISENKAKDLQNDLQNFITFDGDIDIQYGGQPLYYYVISIE
ncbi:DAK2 domain-containing protein [Thermoanaerobacterium thermosaccharolyticum]|uniref:DAK2 domain-containing protein n=1 Tax=Thermoanaerobacterium thermosaccharolyticum TaxID=1517 RepID=UPI0017837BC1|nr:DAK2 domain-containing protein [Thermoanaerobacterium thermosaccharolyticum]MBE0068308.1 DAK2 domain-containing protein [Thermoanaerobacterium thermosaccharolyticum]MBE0228172.1 DAK2 domain-containing protein [Thermoanaerobacterium thermosaccharolyticum]